VICVAEFEYRLQNGIHVRWAVTVSGYDDFDDANRERVTHDTLVDVESTMDRFERQYADLTGAYLVAVKGAHGWREFEWSSGAVHRYEWNHFEVDLRCPRCGNPDNDPYMVTDELWASSGLESYECFRCLENAIGRQLVPVDFKRGSPANDGHHHGPELRRRIGGQASAVNEPKGSVAAQNTADAGAYVQHVAPIWRDRMDFVFNAALPEDCAPKRFEQLVGHRVADGEFQLCCIPFFLYDVSLGDVVATTGGYILDRVVRPSGRYTFRVYFGGKTGAKDQIAARSLWCEYRFPRSVDWGFRGGEGRQCSGEYSRREHR
jgi:hypothetical protein